MHLHHAGREMWQKGHNVERDRKIETLGRQETMCADVCLSTCVCACMVTKQELMHGHRWIQGQRGAVVVAVVLSVVQQPLPPALCRVH